MDVVLRYYEGCPAWRLTEQRLLRAFVRIGDTDVRLRQQVVTSAVQADVVGFQGSPTILIDGRDPFADPAAPTGLYSRAYRTPVGLAAAPTVDQLVALLRNPDRPAPATIDLTRLESPALISP